MLIVRDNKGIVMNLETFKAPTMAECLAQVKQKMGHDAVILHTRSYQSRVWLGLKRREIVEITAGQGMPPRRPSASKITDRPVERNNAYSRTGAAVTHQPTVAPASVAAAVKRPGQGLLETPAASNAMMRGLSEEMHGLKSLVKDLVVQVRSTKCPNIPEDLFGYYMQLIENQVTEELAGDIIRTIKQQVRPEHLTNDAFMKEKLCEQLEKMLPVAGPICRKKLVGPHIVALIGPTGVGKTTTVAKLAATLKLREKHRVGLITLDTYRIAAVDQLRKYADIIGAPLRVVQTTEELKEAIEAMASYEYIIVDTAGRSPNDTLKLNELKTFIDAAHADEVHLVLSSTASQACVELAVQRFSEIGADRIIFTKLDEAAHVGVVLSVVRRVNKSLSYLTTGQDVPADIEVGHGRRLGRMILGMTEEPRGTVGQRA